MMLQKFSLLEIRLWKPFLYQKKPVQNTANCWQKKFESKLGSLFVELVMEHVDRPVNLILNPKGI